VAGDRIKPVTRRDVLKTGGALTAAGAAGLYAPAVIGQSKPFDGVTLNVSCWSAPYPKWLADYLPEFENLTGAKVNYDTPGFPIYNQRVDLELSTQGSAYDVLNITFIYTSRWIGAGWFEPLQPYMEDPSKTPLEWEPADFLPGAVAPLKDSNGVIHGPGSPTPTWAPPAGSICSSRPAWACPTPSTTSSPCARR
jgi:multiple sugar transport system substrate-binding protein